MRKQLARLAMELLGVPGPSSGHGFGIPPLTNEHVAGAKLYANRSDALDDLPRGEVVAEIGVAAGEFTDVILKKLEPERFDAFDIFRLHEAKVATARPTSEMFGGKTHLEFYRNRYATYIDRGTFRILIGD